MISTKVQMTKKIKSLLGVMIILTLLLCGCAERSVTWQEAYHTYIHKGLDLCLEGMNTSLMEFSDEYNIPLDNFTVDAIDLKSCFEFLRRSL